MTGGRPLEGKCIVVTRPERRAGPLTDRLHALGARVIEAPAIRIEPPSDFAPLDEALDRIASYHFVVFTSANGVDSFFDRFGERNPGGELPPLRFAAVGPATAASLAEKGCAADVIPERFVAEEVFRALAASGDVAGKRFLLPRADIARESLVGLLASRGAFVDSVEAYRTVPDPEAVRRAAELVGRGEVDVVTFTSASTVRSFFAGLEGADAAAVTSRIVAASIGPVTSAALRDRGVEPAIEAGTSTAEGLVDAIVRYLRPSRES